MKLTWHERPVQRAGSWRKLLKMLVAETENFGSLIQVYAASLRCDAIA
jgi:hypothetical protein